MIRQLAFFLAFAASRSSAIELTPDNWASETDGKTVFVKVNNECSLSIRHPDASANLCFVHIAYRQRLTLISRPRSSSSSRHGKESATARNPAETVIVPLVKFGRHRGLSSFSDHFIATRLTFAGAATVKRSNLT